eukprot:397507_1
MDSTILQIGIHLKYHVISIKDRKEAINMNKEVKFVLKCHGISGAPHAIPTSVVEFVIMRKKTHITNYFSTKIWEFAMKCHICKGIIKICTDPQQCDYKITEGGKRQVTTYSTDDLELINVQSDAHKEKMETDPIYRLQHQEMDKKHKLQNALRLQALHSLQERDKNDYDNNCNLRRKLRAKKKQKQQLQKHADAKGFALPLLEFNEEDEQKAKHVQFKKEISAKKKIEKEKEKN